MESYTKFGLMDGMLSFVLVFTIDLWLFWIPGNLEIKSTPELSRRYRYMIRSFNISVGLLLTTPNNPIYNTIVPTFLRFIAETILLLN